MPSSLSSQTSGNEDEKEGRTINVLTRDQNLLLDIIEDIPKIKKKATLPKQIQKISEPYLNLFKPID